MRSRFHRVHVHVEFKRRDGSWPDSEQTGVRSCQPPAGTRVRWWVSVPTCSALGITPPLRSPWFPKHTLESFHSVLCGQTAAHVVSRFLHICFVRVFPRKFSFRHQFSLCLKTLVGANCRPRFFFLLKTCRQDFVTVKLQLSCCCTCLWFMLARKWQPKKKKMEWHFRIEFLTISPPPEVMRTTWPSEAVSPSTTGTTFERWSRTRASAASWRTTRRTWAWSASRDQRGKSRQKKDQVQLRHFPTWCPQMLSERSVHFKS